LEKGCEIKEHDWTDGPSPYGRQFVFTNTDGRKIQIGSFKKKDEAEQHLKMVAGLIHENLDS
jgi:hypothetical protein